MNSKPFLRDFLATLSAQLQAVSHGVLRALIALANSLARISIKFVLSVARFFSRAGAQAWRIYIRMELSLVEAIAASLLIFWSLRLLALVLAPAFLLCWFQYWWYAAAYAAFLGFAIWRYYTAREEEVERAAEEHAPIREFLVRFLRLGVRACLILLTCISAIAVALPRSVGSVDFLLSQWDQLQDRAEYPPAQHSASKPNSPKLVSPKLTTRPLVVDSTFYSRCTGSPEPDKCENITKSLLSESPEQARARSEQLEQERRTNMEIANSSLSSAN